MNEYVNKIKHQVCGKMKYEFPFQILKDYLLF